MAWKTLDLTPQAPRQIVLELDHGRGWARSGLETCEPFKISNNVRLSDVIN